MREDYGPRLECILLIDTSSSMKAHIDKVNESLRRFKEGAMLDEMTCKRVDVSIIEFDDDIKVVQDFVPVEYLIPQVDCGMNDSSKMGDAIEFAIDTVKKRNKEFASCGIPMYSPWIFMISDGCTTDDISNARQRIIDEESNGTHGKLKFWAVGVPGYSKDTLSSLAKRCVALDTVDFRGIFDWGTEPMVCIGRWGSPAPAEFPPLPPECNIGIPEDW